VETPLQGRPRTAQSPERRLTYFTMGEERWKTTTTWPPPGTEDRSWYFATAGTLVTTKPTNREGADRYTVDFEATTGTTNRWATNNTGDDVRYPSRRMADRRLLTYTSLPLPDDIEMTGQPRVALNVASTHSDGAFFVYLEEVAPEGTVRYLTEGGLRAIHRKVSNEDPPYRVVGPYHSFKRKDALPLVPHQITGINLQLMTVSSLVRARHRLCFPSAGADVNTFRRITDEGVPTFTVYHSAAPPSCIFLPVMRQ